MDMLHKQTSFGHGRATGSLGACFCGSILERTIDGLRIERFFVAKWRSRYFVYFIGQLKALATGRWLGLEWCCWHDLHKLVCEKVVSPARINTHVDGPTRRNNLVACLVLLFTTLGFPLSLRKGRPGNKCRLDRFKFVGAPSGGTPDNHWNSCLVAQSRQEVAQSFASKGSSFASILTIYAVPNDGTPQNCVWVKQFVVAVKVDPWELLLLTCILELDSSHEWSSTRGRRLLGLTVWLLRPWWGACTHGVRKSLWMSRELASLSRALGLKWWNTRQVYTVLMSEFPWTSKLIKSNFVRMIHLWTILNTEFQLPLTTRIPVSIERSGIYWTSSLLLSATRSEEYLMLMLWRMQQHPKNSINKLLCPSVCQSISLYMKIFTSECNLSLSCLRLVDVPTVWCSV